MRQIAEQLKQAKHEVQGISPDPDWVAKNKAQLLTQIENTVSDKNADQQGWSVGGVMRLMHLLAPKSLVHAARPVMSLVMVAVVAVGGSIATVSASQNSLPGDMLWNVKLAAERTQQIVTRVTSDEDDSRELVMEFAQRRADEIKRVIDEQRPDANERIDKAMKQLHKNIDSINHEVVSIKENQPDRVVDVAKDINEKTDRIMLTFDEILYEGVMIDSDSTNEIAATSKAIEQASFEALQAAAEQDLDGAEIREMLTKKIERIVNDTEKVEFLMKQLPEELFLNGSTVTSTEKGEETDDPTNSTSTSGVSTSSMDSAPASSTLTTGGESSADVSDNSEEPKSIAEVKQAIDERSGTVRLEVDLILGLVEVNALDEAVRKVRELSDVTAENKEAVVEVKRIATEMATEETPDPVLDTGDTTTTVTTSTVETSSTVSVTQTPEAIDE